VVEAPTSVRRVALAFPTCRVGEIDDYALDVVAQAAALKPAVNALGSAGIQVSLFIDPDLDQVEAAARSGR